VAAEDFLDFVPVSAWRHDHPAGAHQRFAEEGRDRLWAFAQDRLVKLFGEAGGKGLLALARLSEPPMVRAGNVDEIRQRQIEIAMVPRVTIASARDDLLLLPAAARIVIVTSRVATTNRGASCNIYQASFASPWATARYGQRYRRCKRTAKLDPIRRIVADQVA
jgi:hypothetical protein